jgi:hypothetical protein
MAPSRKKDLLWWKILAMTAIAGLSYAGFVASHWDRFMSWGQEANQEYSDKDLLQCEPGTHQEKGRCVSNPVASHPAPAPAPPAQK